MASIQKLAVRGIRAFSPDDEEQASVQTWTVISFCFPLTIIVGANGCGKTTIIEALRYAVAGSLPPGNKSGQAFVHDPKSVGCSSVKANVKLKFTNRAGKAMITVRSMELIQKKTTMQFKNLDGVLRTTDANGNSQSLSHKCTELDRQIPQLLGVSKAVLENVIFCHQEDSSWPLMEGAVLKKRFDAIFDSTRYVKALEEIKNQKKIYSNKVKDLTAELNLLKGHKHAANGFRNDLDECKHQLSLIQDQMTEHQEKKAEEKKKADKLSELLQKGDELRESIDEKQNHIENENVRIDTHKEGLRKDLTNTKTREDLENILKGFKKAMEGDTRDLRRLNDRIVDLESKIAELKRVQVDMSEEKGRLLGEKNAHDANLQSRIELMEDLGSKYGLELSFSQTQQTQGLETQQSRFSTSSATLSDDGISELTSGTRTSQEVVRITSEDLDAFRRSVDLKLKELEDQLNKHREQSARGEDNIQMELRDLSGKIQSYQNDLERLEGEREKAKKEIQKMTRTISSSRMRKSDIDEAKRQAAKYSKIQNDLSNDTRITEIPREIKENESKVENSKLEIKEISDVLIDLRRCAEEQNAIDMLSNQVSQDMELIEEMKNENSFLLQQYKVEIPLTDTDTDRGLVSTMESLAGDIGEKYDTAARSKENSSQVVREKESLFSELSAVLKQNKISLARKERELAELGSEGRGVQRIRTTIRAVRQYEQKTWGESIIPASIQPQQLLEHFSSKMGDLATETDQPEAISRTMMKLKKLAKQKDSSGNIIGIICPCCTRALGPDDVPVFQENMQTLADVTNSPIVEMDLTKAKMNASATRNYELWRNSVSGGINDWLDHKRILTEVDKLKESNAEGEEKLKNVETELDDAKKELSEDNEEEDNLKQLQDLIVRLRDDVSKVANKKNQISAKKEELSLIAPNASGKDLRSTEREFNSKTEEKDSAMHKISALNKELSQLTEGITRAANQATKANKITRDKEERFAQEQQALTRKQELNKIILQNGEQIEKIQDQIIPIRSKARTKEAETKKLRTETKKEESKRHDLLNECQNDSGKISHLSLQIDQFESSNKSERLAALDSELKSITDEIEEHDASKRNLAPELEQVKARVSNQEAHKTDVTRNIDLLDMYKDRQILEDELVLLQDEMDKLNLDDINAQFSKAKRSIDKSTREYDRCMGSKDSSMIQMRDLKRKLATKEYKDVDEKHRVKMIETETSKMAVSDLELYYSALDKALLRYHALKIKDINKIIKEMWTLTYRGEDITSIRLTSDQEKSSKASKSYNYRVVMTKGTTELDMRGRCSAGQRVLASLVIRLALAETFCINCGVMALDEPTTNLDHKNKYGLAVALAQIISNRASQDNFQLVIITHDEEFVSMMKQELASQTGFTMPDRYFQVSREESSDGCYYSKIKCIDWDEI